jgi:hypothetical protein
MTARTGSAVCPGKLRLRMVTVSALSVLAAALAGCSSVPASAEALRPWTAASVPSSASSPPRPRQLTGAQLNAALLPGKAFPAGYKIDSKLSSDSGSAVESSVPQQTLPGMSCKDFENTFEGAGFGETAFAQRIITSSAGTAFFNQTVYQFASAPAAASFFSGVRTVAMACPSFTSTSNGSPSHETLHVSAAPQATGSQAYTIRKTSSVVLDGFTVNSVGVYLVAMDGADIYEVSAFSATGTPPPSPSLSSVVKRLVTRLSAQP